MHGATMKTLLISSRRCHKRTVSINLSVVHTKFTNMYVYKHFLNRTGGTWLRFLVEERALSMLSHVQVGVHRPSKGRFTHAMPRPCPTPTVPCPSIKSAWWPEISELLVQQFKRFFFCSVLLPLFSPSMTNCFCFHAGHLHLRLVCL
jgi:hypothetical protein